MLLQTQTVSRKTPGDGRLEITPETAERIAAAGTPLRVEVSAEHASAELETLSCTCGKRPDGPHLHHFLASPLLRGLTPGGDVRLELASPGLVRILAVD